ncbi:MAG: energy transducer TonB [Flavobacterium sp.]|nr:energy transducer TonB [Flavobacterium sp.]
MSSTNSSDQKKSLLIATLLYGTLLLILFFIRFWPPANLEQLTGGGGGGGVTVNFGDSDLGSGANYKSEVLNVKNQVKQTPTKAIPDEAILSQENSTEESVVIPQKEKPLKPTPVLKEEPKPVVVAKPKVSNTTNDALSNIMKGSNKGGDGDDKTAGNKGKANGSLSSTGYYGTGGSGGGTGGGNGTGTGTGSGYGAGTGGGSGNGTGYSLGNRKAISKPAPKYTCNEEGKVVVEVSVDRNGRTTNAIAGIKGTTNTAKCLLDQARIAAMNTRWDASSDAPEKQVGKIVYNFNLN